MYRILVCLSPNSWTLVCKLFSLILKGNSNHENQLKWKNILGLVALHKEKFASALGLSGTETGRHWACRHWVVSALGR